jgi:hypothetical protein
MSWQSAEEPEARTPPSCKALDTVIVPRPRDIGGFEVRRVLPSSERPSVVEISRGQGIRIDLR